MKGLKITSVLLMLLSVYCSRMTTDITPDQYSRYHSLKIKVNVKSLNSNQRQSFRVVLKYSANGDKLLFLSPLNQVYGLLVVKNESALMVNTRKKKYWQGPFQELLKYMWGPDMDFLYTEFKALMVRGIVPNEKVRSRGLDISVQAEPEGSPPQRMEIKSRDIVVKVKISDRNTGSGKLSLKTDISHMKESSIDDLLE